MTIVLRQDAAVDGALVGIGHTVVRTAAGAVHDRPGRDPVSRRESPVGPGPLDVGRASRLPGPGAGRWAWQQRAACQGMDSSRFFGPERERATAGAARIAAAKGVCADCSVVLECRVFALHSGEPYGVWGGLSEYERAEILDSIPAGSSSSPRWMVPAVTVPGAAGMRSTPTIQRAASHRDRDHGFRTAVIGVIRPNGDRARVP
jgi:WhiB family transcriptional regulator, redox-sensing transcriptional regulator